MIKLIKEKPSKNAWGGTTQHCTIVVPVGNTGLQRALKFFSACDASSQAEEIEISDSEAKEILRNLVKVEREGKTYRTLKGTAE